MIAAREERWWRGALVLALVLGVAAWCIHPQSGLMTGMGALLLLPWGISLVVWGLPHGATDHFLVARFFSARTSWPVVLAAAMTYLALALATGVFWVCFPRFAFAGFIILTWIHWGSADLWWSWSRDREALPSKYAQVFFLLWRGALPMLVPLILDPETYRRTAEAATDLYGRGGDWTFLEATNVRLLALATCLALGCLRWITAGKGRGATTDLREDVALLLFFSLVPALPAVGLYFTFWHGWRHVLRLQNKGLGTPGPDRYVGRSFVREAWPTTLVSLLILLALARFLPVGGSLWSLLGIYLLLIACLTVPHAILVTYMDWECGLWKKVKNNSPSGLLK